MDDRQRQFAQLATALNQYAGSNAGSNERGLRERSATDGRSSTGSTSSGSSNSSGNAAASFWGDLGRSFPFNYSSAWPQQGGHDLHRLNNYVGNFSESENRSAMDSRSESRRVPSKGETKATPPLPQQHHGSIPAGLGGTGPHNHGGLPGGMGSAIASLQQLVGLPSEEVYRTLMAQQYAAAAALSALPPSSRPSPISPSGHSTHPPPISPNQLHHSSAASRHQQQQQQALDHKHLQQQFLLQQQQRARQQQKSSSPHQLLPGMPHQPNSTSPNMNGGEYFDIGPRVQASQLSPLTSRKERILEQHSSEAYQKQVQSPPPNPQQPPSSSVKCSSLSPMDPLSTAQLNERVSPRMGERVQQLYNCYESEGLNHNELRSGSDIGGGTRSGSESEGDNRARHRRKQDQPRRQSVIYSNSAPHLLLPQQQRPSIGSGESSSDESQGYDSVQTLASHNDGNPPPVPSDTTLVASHLEPVRDTIRNSSPLVSVPNNEHVSNPLQISEAMNHALSHPFLAAHLNTSPNSFTDHKINKPESNQYRSEYNYQQEKYSDPHLRAENKNASYFRQDKSMNESNEQLFQMNSNEKHPYASESNVNSLYCKMPYGSDQGLLVPQRQADTAGSQFRSNSSPYDNASADPKCYEAETMKESDFDNNVLPPNNKTSDDFPETHAVKLGRKEELKSIAHHKDYDPSPSNSPHTNESEPSHRIYPTNTKTQPSSENSQQNELQGKDSNTVVDLPDKQECSKESKTPKKQAIVNEEKMIATCEKAEKIVEDNQLTSNPKVTISLVEPPIEEFNSGIKSPVKPLMNGSVDEHKKQVSAEATKKDSKKLLHPTTEYFNGDREDSRRNISPSKRGRRKAMETIHEDTLSPDYNDNKRRTTRQKRPVSYVEDETDPILEMAEEFHPRATPLLSPAKKRGRRSKDKSDSEPLVDEISLSSPPKSYLYDSNSSLGSTPASNISQTTPNNLKEPLHIDTSCYSRPDIVNNSTSTLHSPDIYDFNDLDGDSSSRGRNKRGRKRGSPKKQGRVTPEFFRANISPRAKEPLNNNKSKFFSNSRTSVSPEHLRLSGSSENLKTPEIKNKYPASQLLPKSSSLVDEVEMQLAALHKEHMEHRTSTPPMDPPPITTDQPIKQPVQKPLLSVIPLEQLTYEGLNKKSSSYANVEKEENKEAMNEQTSNADCNDSSAKTFLPLPNTQSSDKVELNSNSPVVLGEKSDFDLSENIPLYNENFDSESESSVLYTKKLPNRGKRSATNLKKNIFDPSSPLNSSKLAENKDLHAEFDARKENMFDGLPENVQIVSIAEVPSSSPVLGRISRGGRGNRKRGRGGRNKKSNRKKNAEEEENTEQEPETNGSSTTTNVEIPKQDEGPSSENNNACNGESSTSSSQTPVRRRSRRSTNPQVNASPTASPTHVTSFEQQEKLSKKSSNGNANEAETIEDIAKFLEDTAPSDNSLNTSLDATPSTSFNNEPSTSSYKESRPKRVSRPPPEMNDGEMNDLLLLLNMEDEESDDEDYIVPKEALDRSIDSDNAASAEGDSDLDDSDLSDNEINSRRSSNIAVGGSSLMTESHLSASNTAKRRKREDSRSKKSSSKNKKSLKNKSKRTNEDSEQSRNRKDDRYDRRGPILKYFEREGTEVIINAPNRDTEEQEINKKLCIPFYCDLQIKRSGIGYSSTLHNNYDAFNKDLSWLCAFCKNYSHHHKLGDLFGPFFIKGLIVKKKNLPEVIEGQVASDGFSCSMNGVPLETPPRARNKRTPKHDSNDQSSDPKKPETDSHSPPVRFVPAATPARMLGRGGATPRSDGLSSPRSNALHSPTRNNLNAGGTSTSAQSSAVPSCSTEPVVNPALGTECWIHEECILWASGVTSVNSKLCGLEEAVMAAQESICSNCGETGATVSCLGKGCFGIVHLPCAKMLSWSLNTVTFQSFCPKHIVSKGCVYPKGVKKS